MPGPQSRADRTGDLDTIVEAFIYLYTESRRITKGLAEQHGLTGPQFVVMKMLEPVGRLSLSQLSDKIQARNSTVTGIIDRMERENLVVRRRSEEDRRVVHIELTAKGKRLAGQVTIEPMQIFKTVLGELTARDAADLKRILTKLARRVTELVEEKPEHDRPKKASSRSRGSRAGAKEAT